MSKQEKKERQRICYFLDGEIKPKFLSVPQRKTFTEKEIFFKEKEEKRIEQKNVKKAF